MAGFTYDVWSPDNIKRFQRGMGLKGDGVVGPKTRAAMGTQTGANWLLGDYNRGIANASPVDPTQTDNQLFNNGKSYTLSGGRVNKPITGLSVVPGSSGTEPWGVMNTAPLAAKNEALYSIGNEWGNMAPDQQAIMADRLTGLDTKELIGTDISKTSMPTTDISKTSMPTTNWIDGMSNYEAMQGITGGLGLASSLYSTFGSGGTMDVNKKNIELMNQQIANNREEMANRKAYRADIAKAFGPKTGLGV